MQTCSRQWCLISGTVEQRHLLGTSPFCYDHDDDDHVEDHDEDHNEDHDDHGEDHDDGDGGEEPSEEIVSQGNQTLDKAPFSFSSLSSSD